ncbi:7256_t:CDS:2 [Paraglomus brasilianum]|uniref:7256_t:CDS:1 n=1 Tax=Paraglomus brasilianum TaxID=144538 RepID=A0A9N9C0D3_9GLOM|nr:7256_t:CDS:2 [Paraglomus brasilianum]
MIKILFLITLFVTAAVAVPFFSENNDDTLAPLISSPGAEVVPDQYIVVFKDEIAEERVSCHHHDIGGIVFEERKKLKRRGFMADFISGIKHTYNIGSFKGYAGKFSHEVLHKIRQSEDVAYVEKDQVVRVGATEPDAPWGLARISHRGRDGPNIYEYDSTAGEGVTVYVIDTGIYINHTDFGGRAEWGVTIPANTPDTDDNGHGTHVSGTIAGTRYGVAKNARLVAIRVFDANGVGFNSDVIKGIDWAVTAHNSRSAEARRTGEVFKGSVINMSLRSDADTAVDAATNAAVDKGVVVAVAAGNDDDDACTKSPARAANAITVGATGADDTRAYFSNWGQCLTIFAPGVNVLSAYIGSPDATRILQGTSMASPHVAGLSAYILGLTSSPLTPTQVKDRILFWGTRGILNDVGTDSPNLLAFNGYNLGIPI